MYISIFETAMFVEKYIKAPRSSADKPLRVALSGHKPEEPIQRYFYASEEAEARSDYADTTICHILPQDGEEKIYEAIIAMASIAEALCMTNWEQVAIKTMA